MRPPADWEIRAAEDEDVEAVVELLRSGLGRGTVPRSAAFWRWKHQAGTFGPSPVLVAEAGGRLVGVRAFLRWRWHLDCGGAARAGSAAETNGAAQTVCTPESVPAVRAVDTVTHPDWRGRGLFSTLTRRLVQRVADDGAAFVFNTPNARSGPGYLKMGWREVGRLPIYVRPLRARALPVALLAGLSRGLGGAVDAGGSGRAEAGGRDGNEGTAAAAGLFGACDGGESAEGGAEPMERFLARPSTPGLLARLGAGASGSRATADSESRDPDAMPTRRYRTLLTADYLRWRYAAVPGIDYCTVAGGVGEGAAALVLRGRRRGGLGEVSVSEILAAPGRAGTESAAGLLRRLGDTSDADYAVAVASPGSPEHAALRRAGFLRLPAAGPRFYVRPLPAAPTAPPLTEPASWRWTTGSCELF